MANKILTPITLWSDFNDSLPIQCTVLEEREEDGVLLRKLRCFGRDVGGVRVNIFAVYCAPAGETAPPALLILPDASQTADVAFVERFAKKGYAVLMPDYRGEWDGCEEYTIYPEAIPYANYRSAGRRLDFAYDTAKETSWYEWVAVARYCCLYLRSLAPERKIGLIGIRAGGEIAWQLAATFEGIACAIPVCAGGWRAYRGVHKFGESTELKMDDERYRFLAGVDSQAYAQYAKCPVLMLCSTNDENFDADRAFDTFARINPEMDKTFYFAARYNGHIGKTGLNDLDLFIDKYLKGREVFIPAPVEIGVEEDEGELVARIKFDRNGEVKYCDVYMAEDNLDSPTRDWTKCTLKREDGDDEQLFTLNAYENASRVFVFAKAKYSCGFAVSSKIAVKRLENAYSNSQKKSRILYSSTNGTDSFTIDRFDKNVVADCFLNTAEPPVRLTEGPLGIRGVYSSYGLKFFRINDARFRPGENGLLKFDIYSPRPTILQVCIGAEQGGTPVRYSCALRVAGGECWADHLLSAKDFKSEINKPLSGLNAARYITFYSQDEFCINNLLWL